MDITISIDFYYLGEAISVEHGDAVADILHLRRFHGGVVEVLVSGVQGMINFEVLSARDDRARDPEVPQDIDVAVLKEPGVTLAVGASGAVGIDPVSAADTTAGAALRINSNAP